MRMQLFGFQEDAIAELNKKIEMAHILWSYSDPQVISFSAPTGSGKTIMLTALFEEILFGSADRLAEPDAIFIWISDSPMLNEQTRFKIEGQSDKIRVRDLVTVDASFDAECLECGHIYFLNTQKLGSDKLLTTLSDKRQYSIWTTIANTAKRYPDKLYVVIDEAHRGTAFSDRDVKKAHSIMQKFVKGSIEDRIPAMPLVIGVSATPQRFEKLLEGTASTVQKVQVTVNAVRESGLLKDRIIIAFPDMPLIADMSVLKSAVENWLKKCLCWEKYCKVQKEQIVKPVLVIQVEDGSSSQITSTDIAACLSCIEDVIGRKLSPGEVVHTFNGYDTLSFRDADIRYVDASRIEEDTDISVVFFKMNLSTGWDCPRAETMMSFRGAQDYTYIAQLLGRMIRTPMARRIESDAELNNVGLFLPYFDKDTVGKVIEALRDNEMAAPAEIGTSREMVTLKRNPAYADVFDAMGNLVTYHIDSVKKQKPLRLLMEIARALTMDGIDLQAQRNTKNAVIARMSEQIEALKERGAFETLAKGITGLTMGEMTFNYGENVYTFNEATNEVSVMDYDVRRHFEQAGRVLGDGLHTEYWIKNSDRDENDVWVEIIVLVNNTEAMETLDRFSKAEFFKLYEENRRKIATLSEVRKQFYTNLISASATPIAMPWELPETIDFTVTEDSKCFDNHLYINNSGEMKTSLNSWEEGVLNEEMNNGAVCWLRNIDRKSWALCVPYEINGVTTSMYPDMLIVRADKEGYVFDILEPHDGSRKDNCPKAVGLAKFAEKHWDKFGRIELIRQMKGPDNMNHFYRLDMSKTTIRNKVRGITNNAELDRIFDEDSIRED